VSPKEITLETRLAELGIDSLRAITIPYELEEQFAIQISNQVIEPIKSIGDIITSLSQLRKDTDSACPNAYL
jgi:acyl carrier protein